MSEITHFFHQFWLLWLESAPWLILGLLIAGVLKGLIPQKWMERQLGGNSRSGIVKAAFLGAPLPLCSCGVVPAAMGLRDAGASKGSTVSFLVATPETGPDSISLSYALLGPFMAIIRPIAAISSAITAGFLVRHETHEDVQTTDSQNQQASVKSPSTCCSSKAVNEETHKTETKSCCSSEANTQEQTDSTLSKLQSGLQYSFGKLLADISFWLLLGIAVAAAIQAWVPASMMAEWGSGFTAMLIMAVVGVPMYICASASTPMAAGFLAAGISPGAVLVFMLAGPATNIGTLGIIKKTLGKQALVAYLSGVIVVALAFGLLTDYLVEHYNVMSTVIGNIGNEHAMGWFAIACGILFAIAMVNANWRKLVKA